MKEPLFDADSFFKHYADKDTKATMICRTEAQRPAPHKYTQEEDDYIRMNLHKKTFSEIAEHLGLGKGAIRHRSIVLGLIK